MTVFVSALPHDDKALALRTAAQTQPGSLVCRRPSDFSAIPGSPFAYWLSDDFRALFITLGCFEDGPRTTRIGASTKNNGRFLRAWWEVRSGQNPPGRWRNFAKGEPGEGFYADIVLVINWGARAGEIEAELLRKYPYLGDSADFVLHRENGYGWPGYTWPLRASRFKPRALPMGVVFSDRGYGARTKEDELLPVLSVLSSRLYDYLYKTSLGRFGYPEFIVGTLKRMPWVDLNHLTMVPLGLLGRSGWSLVRSLDTPSEVSHAFVVPALLQVEGPSFDSRVAAWAGRVAGVEAELDRVRSEIDELCFDLYGISEEDRRAITEGFGVAGDEDDSGEDGEDDSDGEAVELDPAGLAAGLVSWAVGVAVGRFDVRLATGERDRPPEPDPFDPLPVCSPGMLTGEDGLPLDVPLAGYPAEVSPVLVDDPGHDLDITAGVRGVFDVVFGADADRWWADVGTALGARGGEVASWLSKGFFDHHMKTYSKSRRKAPILWPLGTASGSYLVWIYAHRVTGDSLFRVLNDVVSPKLALEQRRLTDLVQEAGPNPTAGQRKAIDAQDKLVDELQDLAQQLNAVAPVWYPDLNDGVVIVLAPLWRLFAHHRAWSRELRKHWDKLQAGDYDWAQLAMNLWPERVVPKCAQDRSLAIAHRLEDVFWVQDDNNPDKWHPRETPTTPIGQLVAQRTNPTTTATLQGRI